mmetsp:Transcript_34201/g.50790  ORF Transcript_34201/g.50790 Transcript_34201/m.50790 type:complete len:96 (+) Transcript_34201:375-662(+)
MRSTDPSTQSSLSTIHSFIPRKKQAGKFGCLIAVLLCHTLDAHISFNDVSDQFPKSPIYVLQERAGREEFVYQEFLELALPWVWRSSNPKDDSSK